MFLCLYVLPPHKLYAALCAIKACIKNISAIHRFIGDGDGGGDKNLQVGTKQKELVTIFSFRNWINCPEPLPNFTEIGADA